MLRAESAQTYHSQSVSKCSKASYFHFSQPRVGFRSISSITGDTAAHDAEGASDKEGSTVEQEVGEPKDENAKDDAARDELLDESEELVENENRVAEENGADFESMVSMNTFVEKLDVANMAIFLMTNKSSKITGQILTVDGNTERMN
mgnify:CR=1 FL=1